MNHGSPWVSYTRLDIMDTTVKSQPMQDSEASEPTYTKSIEKINYPWFLPTIDKYLKPEVWI